MSKIAHGIPMPQASNTGGATSPITPIGRSQTTIAPARPSSAGRLQMPGYNGAGGDEYKGLFVRDATERDRWASDRAREILDDFSRGQGTKWLA